MVFDFCHPTDALILTIYYGMRKFGTIILFLLMLLSCESEQVNSFQITRRFVSPIKVISTSYSNYLETISKQDLPILSFQENVEAMNESIFVREFQKNENLQYLPASLWQLFQIDEGMEWKNLAEIFSEIILKSQIIHEPGDGEFIHASFLTPYQITGDQKYYRLYMESLNQLISDYERSGDLDFSSGKGVEIELERLLENELYFYATYKTGDPAYRELALELSDQIFQLHFQNIQSNEVFYGLANWNTLPHQEELEKLERQDFYKLSVSFYSFATLYKETGYSKYGVTALKLNELFVSILEGDKLNIKDKLDLTSRALVCLAMSRMSESYEEIDKRTSERIFRSLLADLETRPSAEDQQYSFRMYYYLFECLIQE